MTEHGATPVVLARRAETVRPLTPIQQEIWASQRLAPSAPLANMATAHRIVGPLDVDRFADAFERVVRASDALRTVVEDRPGEEPRARVLVEPPGRTSVVDVPAAEVDTWCRHRVATPIDARQCGFDSVLLRHGSDEWTWWLDLHHLITDAWSSMLVFDAVSETYRGLVDDAPTAPWSAAPLASFYEYAAGRRSDTGDRHDPTPEDGEATDALSSGPITPYGPRGARTTEVTRRALPVESTLHDPHARYRTISPELGALALLATTTAVTLHRLDGRQTLRLGVPLHNRRGNDAKAVIGPLLEIRPMEVVVDPASTFADLFDRVHRDLFGMLRATERRRERALDAVINVQTANYGDFAGLPTSSRWIRSNHVESAHPIRLHVYDYGEGRRLELDLNGSLSTDGAHLAFADHLTRTIEVANDDPDTVVGDYDLIGDEERAVLDGLNPPALASYDVPVHLVVAERLRAAPEQVVAEHEGVELTAAELDQRAEDLAVWLMEHGVGRGARVGLRLRRSFDLLVAVHGVLRAGAAFVMLDPDDPSERQATIIADAELVLVLDRLPARHGRRLDLPAVELDDIAYVLYTSGSTGAPKGVPIPHRGLADYLGGAAATFHPSGQVVMPLYSPVVFDLSITALFLPQLTGGRTVLLEGDPVDTLSKIAADPRLTVLKATPSQLELLCRMIPERLSLEVVIVGGEAFRRPLALEIARRCADDVRIFNEYGPTEAVVGCMLHEWDPQTDVGIDVPIGRASPGAEVFVLDPDGNRTPVGAWGELYVRRPGMAAGYLDLPEVTAARFVEVAGLGEGRLYRTGDRVRVERGVLVYGGRIDDQLSIGGVRLEPGEVEAALVRHPDVSAAVVRVWRPGRAAVRRCVRCGLGTDVPGVVIDAERVCSVCRSFEQIEPQTADWFRSERDLDAARDRAQRRATGDFDCLHLLSGGKDSTYALYQLVARGWRVHALTLDNGFISDGAKENIGRSVADLGISHEFVSTPAMKEIFRDSLDRFANVCNGCYKTIYTLAVARAHELGIPVIVTGLSRGQFFETRLLPHQFEAGRFDPDDIDHTVLQARRAYHRTSDAVTRLLPEQAVFERTDIDVLSEIEFVDFYRYVDVELAEMYEFLASRAPWVRPADTGRSTNCLINVAGIHVHRIERGYHNYAEPYSWDVRLGHKTRDEALEELDDEIDGDEVADMLAEIGYTPRPPELLTAWYQTLDGRPLDRRLLAGQLRELLPDRSIPSAFVHVDAFPMATSNKVDVDALPAPGRTELGSADYSPPNTPTEAAASEIWATILHLDRVGRDDDFFDLGGASLAALETVAAAERRWGVELPDSLVFDHRRLDEFAAALDRHLAAASPLAPIPALDPTLPLPLSPGEEAMLFEYRAAPADVRYNVTRLYTLHTELDEQRLRAALAQAVERHQPLHTSYGERRRRLTTQEALHVEPLPAGQLDEIVDRQRRTPFDLDAGPLVRVHIGRVEDATWQVLIGMHHITVDAGAFDVFWSDVEAIYHGRQPAPLETTYAAHGAWQRALAAAADSPASGDDDVVGVELPPPDDRTGRDGYIQRPADVTTSELAAAAATTPFAAALAAAGVVLSAFSRDGKVEIGITASTRNHPSAESLVGYFLNTVPLVLELDPTRSLAAADDAAGELVAAALPHRTRPFAELVRAARRDGRRVPEVAHMLAYEQLAPVRFGDDAAEHRIVPAGTAVNDLTLFVQERGDELQLGVEYRGSAVSPTRAQQILDTFADVLTTLCRHPGTTVADARAPLTDADLVGPPLGAEPVPPLWRILEHARATPEAVAVVESSGTTTSYRELVGRAAAVAARLHTVATRPRRVGVCLGRSSALIDAIVGVGLAGAAYVPIDPATPSARRRALIDAAELDAIIVDRATSRTITADGRTGVPTLGISDLEPGDHPVGERPSREQPAYVIFTSGSTGAPAGVEVTHANLAASTAAREQFYGPTPPARFLVTPSIGFDSSMVGIFWPLATGGTVVLPADDEVHDVDRVAEIVAARGVSHILMVPSLYRAVLDRHPDRLAELETAIVAGEACPADLVDDHFARLPGVELVNEYGPTEATVWATAHRCRRGDDPVPIGLPIAGCRIRIADLYQRPLAAGTAGELLISSPGVVAGYLGGRSDDLFVDDGEHRWYRTGDLVRQDHEGRIVFVGRVDDQLNVGGLRVEPLELEAHLVALDGVDEAVVTTAVVDGRESIVAHLVGDPTLADLAAVRTHIGERVGSAAAPRRIGHHGSLPRTANGKIDRRRAAQLPLDDLRPAAAPDADPGTVAEVDPVVEIWRTALGRSDLDADSDFFVAGGDSLSAVAIVSALGELMGREVAVAELLTSPTPAAMSAALGIDPTARRDGDDPTGAAGGPVVRLLTLRPGTPGGPTVLMTPAWDSVMGYRALADAFPDDVVVLALVVADAGLDGPSGLRSVDALGSAAMDEIGDTIGRWVGPVVVLGWSIGGVAAYDLGQRLAAAGVEVAAVALIDTYFPGEHRHGWSNRWWKYKSMLRPGGFGEAGKELATMLRRRLEKLAARLGRRLLAWAGQPVERPSVEVTASGIPFSALDNVPSMTSVPVVLYAARTTNPRRTVRRWRTVAPDLRVVPIEGRHRGYQSVMGADRVPVIVDDLLRDRLASASDTFDAAAE